MGTSRLGVITAAFFGAATALTPVSTVRAQCQEVRTWSGANFEGGSFVLQQGFAEHEIAAASYTLPASEFPVKIDLMEMIFATANTTVTTTTHWSILVWEGIPTTGTIVAEYSSDGLILPHIIIPPGTNGVNVQVSVDPEDPEQIIINNTGGSNTFTIGYRIDKHNQQTANPCFTGPPGTKNAFPTTDANGLSSPTNNWLFGVNCGPFGCPANGGWARFSQLPLSCRPSGDWNIRVTYSKLTSNPINDQPDSQVKSPGQTLSLHVGTTGPGPYTYQWYRNGSPLSNGGRISGVFTSTLTVTNLNTGDSAPYAVEVTDSCATYGSQIAQVLVKCAGDYNGDTSVDDFDYFDFLNDFFNNSMLADVNGDTSVDDFDYFDFLNAFFGPC
ncbi:MAG: immunoglobulin domain-containing protein [Phycisphaerae bacterium]|nr:immunoglobulin domain-containing protein [Phycisphaerae bacterium]